MIYLNNIYKKIKINSKNIYLVIKKIIYINIKYTKIILSYLNSILFLFNIKTNYQIDIKKEIRFYIFYFIIQVLLKNA